MSWQKYQKYLCSVPAVDLSLDVSRMTFDETWLESMRTPVGQAFQAMQALEDGAVANPDEKRMVGHYWLRAPELAPTAEIRRDIEQALEKVEQFAASVHAERRFLHVLCIGIGGSALGPMFVADALGRPQHDRMRLHFLDNTDPDGIARVLAGLEGQLQRTLVIVTSKSGGTPETHNGMKLAAAAYERCGLEFARHAVAVTMRGSRMAALAEKEGWLEQFPMFDWVGGRTSELSAVGLLPAALQELPIREMLAGAASCDAATRVRDAQKNPAMLMALMWYKAADGRGAKDLVVLPYKDRLLLLSRYLQQLIMESLGKRLDLRGREVEQGLTVYGNKGSTDQHAYVQQLRDGVANFFVTFIRVLEGGGDPAPVEENFTAADYLHGFLLGTRAALAERGRDSMTLTVRRVDARTVGALIALFERATGFYASLVGINAYHQPGVEAGKKAAVEVLKLQRRIEQALSSEPRDVASIAQAAAGDQETVYLLLEHLAANGRARQNLAGEFFR